MRRWKMPVTTLKEKYGDKETFFMFNQPLPSNPPVSNLGGIAMNELIEGLFFGNDEGTTPTILRGIVRTEIEVLFWLRYSHRQTTEYNLGLLITYAKRIGRKYNSLFKKLWYQHQERISPFKDSETKVNETITQDGKDEVGKNVQHEGESSTQTTSGDEFEDNITTSKTSENKNIPSPIDVNTTAQDRPNQFVVSEDETQTHSTGTRDTNTTTGGQSSSNEDTEETKEWESELVKESTTTTQTKSDVNAIRQYIVAETDLIELIIDEFSRLFVGLIYAD